jgi:hypothetical protein
LKKGEQVVALPLLLANEGSSLLLALSKRKKYIIGPTKRAKSRLDPSSCAAWERIGHKKRMMNIQYRMSNDEGRTAVYLKEKGKSDNDTFLGHWKFLVRYWIFGLFSIPMLK